MRGAAQGRRSGWQGALPLRDADEPASEGEDSDSRPLVDDRAQAYIATDVFAGGQHGASAISDARRREEDCQIAAPDLLDDVSASCTRETVRGSR